MSWEEWIATLVAGAAALAVEEAIRRNVSGKAGLILGNVVGAVVGGKVRHEVRRWLRGGGFGHLPA